MAGRMSSGAAALAELVRAAGETETGGVQRMLPVAPELGNLLPGRGLRRGSTVAVTAGREATAGGGTSLLLALLAEASRAGSWCAVVGVPSLGAIAAAESGIALDRLALVPDPGPEWPTVVAALIDGVDVVVTAVPGGVSGSIASRLVARARQRGSVLVPFGPWSGADVTLHVTAARWEGLGAGHGRLRRREVTIRAHGRGAAARPKQATMWMPGITIRPITLPPAPSTPDPHPTRTPKRTQPAQPSAAPPSAAPPARPSAVSPAQPSGAPPTRPSAVSDGRPSGAPVKAAAPARSSDSDSGRRLAVVGSPSSAADADPAPLASERVPPLRQSSVDEQRVLRPRAGRRGRAESAAVI
ncbi:hypothetical protein SAMN05421748_111231 [Paractinoplanes atraurantiacus]|uniref:Uncharacterized protein n=1 Tax=Paractinoplanes atraurantiacus TaxID=1036182 RepID=A0A285ITV8_9ACTN|nr:hypothetical protein SAMN05421748_111231 [Actinoplanes atraurantiacus]